VPSIKRQILHLRMNDDVLLNADDPVESARTNSVAMAESCTSQMVSDQLKLAQDQEVEFACPLERPMLLA